MNKTCFVMVGVPGCGKSTAIGNIKKMVGATDVRIFSQDKCYLDFCDSMHPGQWWSDHDTDKDMYRFAFEFMQAHQKEFDAYLDARWKSVLESKEVIFIDRTNLSKKVRAKYLQEARAKGFSMVAVEIHIPLQLAIDRQSSRSDHAVPDHVVRAMYMNTQGLLVGTEVDYLMHVDGTAAVFAMQGSHNHTGLCHE